MDLDSIERIQFTALGGADNIVVNDLSKTGVHAGRDRSVGDARQRRR